MKVAGAEALDLWHVVKIVGEQRHSADGAVRPCAEHVDGTPAQSGVSPSASSTA